MTDDSKPTSQSLSVHRGQSVALWKNSLVVRGLQEIAQLDNTRAEELIKEGGALCESGDYEEAIAKCAEAIRLRTDYAEAYCCRGSALRLKGENEKAIADYNVAMG